MSREFPINPLMNGKTAVAPGFFISFDSSVPGWWRWVLLQLPLLESLCGWEWERAVKLRTWARGSEAGMQGTRDQLTTTLSPVFKQWLLCGWQCPVLGVCHCSPPPLLSTTEELEHSFWNPKDTGPQPSLATVSYAVLGSLCNLSKLQGIQL